uniref:hypothetical protein n=1 Tax=Prevotella sp. TaxID=59823 RepID=UPI00402858E2
ICRYKDFHLFIFPSANIIVRAKALYIVRYFKAFALTGRQVCCRNYPGRCPGLRASAPSGRVGEKLAKVQ